MELNIYFMGARRQEFYILLCFSAHVKTGKGWLFVDFFGYTYIEIRAS